MMKSKNFFLTFVMLILLLVSISPSLAEEDLFIVNTNSVTTDFELYASYSEFSVCGCQSFTDTIRITNTGSTPAYYSISANKDYVVVTQSNIFLRPGEKRDVILYVNTPCNQIGSENIVTTVNSNLGVSKEISQKLISNKCSSMETSLSLTNSTLEPCSNGRFSILLKNKAPFPETYIIENNNPFVSLSMSAVSLPQNSYTEIYAFYDFPCDKYGDVNLDFTVYTKNTGEKVNLQKKFSINQNYNYSLVVPLNIDVCANREFTTSLDVYNFEEFPNAYSIRSVMPKFMSFEKGTYLLNASQFTSIPILIKPSLRDVGEHKYSIISKSEIGNVYQKLDATVNVLNCFDANVDVVGSKDILVCGEDEFSKEVHVENTGEFAVWYDFILAGPSFIKQSLQGFYFDSTHRNISLSLDIDDVPELHEKYPVTISVFGDNRTLSQDSFMLTVKTSAECHFASINKKLLNPTLEVTTIPLRIKNDGYKYTEYDLVLENNPSWLQLNSTHLNLGRTQKQYVSLLIDTGARDLWYSTKGLNPLNETIDFSLILDVSGKDVSYKKDIELGFKDKSFFSKLMIQFKSWYFSLIPCFKVILVLAVFSFALLLLLVVALITGNAIKKLHPQASIVLFLICLVAVFVLGYYGGVPTSLPQTMPSLDSSSPDELLILQNTPFSLDLSEFFFDPDNDELSYSARLYDEFLDVSFDGSIATITPLNGFIGNSSIRWLVTDSSDEKTSSNKFNVIVLPYTPWTFSDYLEYYCTFIGIILLIFSTILLILLVSLGYESKKQKKLSTIKIELDFEPKPADNIQKKIVKTTNKKNKTDVKSVTKKASKKKTSRKKITPKSESKSNV